jgi:lipopolysaccharide transport system permease protein
MGQTATAEMSSGEPTIRIRSTRPTLRRMAAEVWAYRELLFFLVWRDVKVRYKQTAIGAAWAIIQPLVTMIMFTIIFGHLVGVKGEYGTPYALFVFSGLLPWTYFAASLSQSGTSLVGSSTLISKVYFPRLIIPLASIVAPIIEFLIAFVILVAMFFYFGRVPHWHAVAMPVFLGMALMTAFGVGLWLSALNVRYRDVPYALPFLTQLWLYATPVIYPVSIVPPRFQWLVSLNPMTGVVDGFRWAVLGRGIPHYSVFGVSAAVGFCIMVGGLWYFIRTERQFADII